MASPDVKVVGKIPVYGWVGLVVMATMWALNWGLEGMRSHVIFLPLWTGYALFMDGLAVRSGRPSIVRRWKLFLILYLLSIPSWWLFELLNERVNYWQYQPEDYFQPLQYFLWSSYCFSTVVPAVFTTGNFVAGLNWFQRHHVHIKTGRTSGGRLVYLSLGIAMLAFTFLWPQYGMAFLWMSLFFILDPVNYALGKPSILRQTKTGDWRAVLVLFTATLICGFFWEMWNYYAYPRWIYTFPFLNGLKVFEMPLAGYLGYLPFGLELYAFTALALGHVPVEVGNPESQ